VSVQEANIRSPARTVTAGFVVISAWKSDWEQSMSPMGLVKCKKDDDASVPPIRSPVASGVPPARIVSAEAGPAATPSVTSAAEATPRIFLIDSMGSLPGDAR
jgi:hypothetical protein